MSISLKCEFIRKQEVENNIFKYGSWKEQQDLVSPSFNLSSSLYSMCYTLRTTWVMSSYNKMTRVPTFRIFVMSDRCIVSYLLFLYFRMAIAGSKTRDKIYDREISWVYFRWEWEAYTEGFSNHGRGKSQKL